MRVRGLKLSLETINLKPIVAPLAGAWIETVIRHYNAEFSEVAPLAGAWIETSCFKKVKRRLNVAPLAGAWIETLQHLHKLICR